MFGLSRETLRRAIAELVDKGLLVRKRGIGTQLVQGRTTQHSERLSSFDDTQVWQRHLCTRVLINEVTAATDAVAAQLSVDPGARVLHLKRLRLADHQPLAILENHLPEHLIGIGDLDLEYCELHQQMRAQGVRFRVTNQHIGARRATPDESSLLSEPKPLLTIKGLTYDDTGRAIERAAHAYRASRYSFETMLISH